jgi:hypothetical protein
MQRIITELVDDIDGSKAEETVRFAIDGVEYEVDLSEKNAKKLRDAVAGYAAKARKVRGGRGRRKTTAVSQVDAKAVRAWAKSNNIELSSRGRIPADVVDQYRKAGN